MMVMMKKVDLFYFKGLCFCLFLLCSVFENEN